MRKHDIEKLKGALKSLIKKQKKSYTDLADHLNVSVPTVKRIMSKEEMSLSRFLEICDWLGVSLADLEVIAGHQAGEKPLFTEEQEKFLAKNPEYLSFFARMHNDTLEQIQKKFQLSDKSLNLYLIRLEKLSLIVKKGSEYRTYHSEFPSLRPYGDLLSAQYKNLIEGGSQFFKRVTSQMIIRKNPEEDKGFHIGVTHATMSRKTYLEWNNEYKKLFEKFLAFSTTEEKIPNLKDKKEVVLMHLSCLLDSNDAESEGLQNMFGQIKELTEKPR